MSDLNSMYGETAIREYIREQIAALKELKAHDISALTTQIGSVERHANQSLVAVEKLLIDHNRAMNERVDFIKVFTDERFNRQKTETEEIARFDRDNAKEALTLTRISIDTMSLNNAKAIEAAFAAASEALHLTEASTTNRFNAVEQRIILTKEITDKMVINSSDLISASIASSKEAILKSENAVERRFESVNEFRHSLNDMQNRLVPRIEIDGVIKSLGEKVDSLNSRMDRMQGSEHKGDKYTATIVSVGALIVSIIVGVIAYASFSKNTEVHGPMITYPNPSILNK
jgi:hypothetical protein